MTGLVSIRDLRKSFGAFEAPRGIDLEIAAGEGVCVVGPSGSGKSTPIRCINRLEGCSDDGAIRVGGVPATPGRALAKVGMVFQPFDPFPP